MNQEQIPGICIVIQASKIIRCCDPSSMQKACRTWWLQFVVKLRLWFIRGVGLAPQAASDSTSTELHTPPTFSHAVGVLC